VALSVALLVRVIGTLTEAAAFLSDEGVLPRTTILQLGFTDRTSLYFANGAPYFAIVLLSLEAVGAICLLIGFRPRVAAAVCWILHLSLAVRNPFIGSGGDWLAPLLLFWAMFLPVGARFSVDAVLAEPTARTQVLNIASSGLLLQASYVYFFGAMMKTSSEWVSDGSAVYLAMHNDAIATRLAHSVRSYAFITQPLSFFVLWIEILTPFLLFSPVFNTRVRALVLPLLIGMHLGFALFLDIGNFWLVSIASLIAFIPSNF
jgi:Vitamin K-dependent gamma-carboxylase